MPGALLELILSATASGAASLRATAQVINMFSIFTGPTIWADLDGPAMMGATDHGLVRVLPTLLGILIGVQVGWLIVRG
jgi:hypothetical protein